MVKPVVSTAHFDLLPFEETDAAFVLSLLNSPGWLQYIGDRNVHSIADAVKYIRERFIASYTANGYGLWTMRRRADGVIVGACGLIKRPSLEHTDIGFALLPDYAGNGYTTEAAQAVIDYAFTTLKLPVIVAITTPDNIASQRVLIKIGLQKTGEMTDPDTQEILYTFRIDNPTV